MRVITVICFAVAAIVASPTSTPYDPITMTTDSMTSPTPLASMKISQGKPSPANAFPYLVSLQYDKIGEWVHFCGGSILSPTKIVTAAHCARLMKNPADWRVAAGKNNLWATESSEQYKYIASIAIHPGSSKIKTANDVAIIEVSRPFKFDEFVQAINLTEAEPKDGDCLTSGWQYQSATFLPDPLRNITIPVVPRNTCSQRYSFVADITDRVICAGADQKSPCFGDTGGPLVCNGTLAGVTSWPSILFCSGTTRPGVFANVAVLQNWIKGQL